MPDTPIPVAPPSGPVAPGPVIVQSVPFLSDPIAMLFMASLIEALSDVLATEGPVSWRAACRAVLAAVGTVVRYRRNTVVQ